MLFLRLSLYRSTLKFNFHLVIINVSHPRLYLIRAGVGALPVEPGALVHLKTPEGMLPHGLVWIAAAHDGGDTLAWGKEVFGQGCMCQNNQHRGKGAATTQPHLATLQPVLIPDNLFLSLSTTGLG